MKQNQTKQNKTETKNVNQPYTSIVTIIIFDNCSITQWADFMIKISLDNYELEIMKIGHVIVVVVVCLCVHVCHPIVACLFVFFCYFSNSFS